MIKYARKFRRDESGAVTVDWVVLTALVAALCGFVVVALTEATNGLGSSTAEYLSNKTIE